MILFAIFGSLKMNKLYSMELQDKYIHVSLQHHKHKANFGASQRIPYGTE